MNRTAYPHDLVPGAIIRVPASPWFGARPYGLEITWLDSAVKPGSVRIGGYVMAQDGTARKRRPHRTIVVLPGKRDVELIRKAQPREFTAVIATLSRPSPDPELAPLLTTRWAVADSDGVPLPGEGTGPAKAGDYVQSGNWEGLPTPWLAREYHEQDPGEWQRRRDPLDQCIDRVRQERGILHVGRLTYDLSVWPHSSAQELRPAGDGTKAWRDTYVCKRCGEKLKFISRSPWLAALQDGDEECHGEVWVP